MNDFVTWPKIARFNKAWEITEKIDGTNGVLLWSMVPGDVSLAQVDDLYLYAGSRNRWLTPEQDNFGFARWAQENAENLVTLGKGRHYGEWYGQGIQRGYGLTEKRFALFDTDKWKGLDPRIPKGVEVVPVITNCTGAGLNDTIKMVLRELQQYGSLVGTSKSEGVIVRHMFSSARFKILIEGDEVPKTITEALAA